MVLLVQREVAERITAPEGNKVYGALSIGVQARADARIAFRVGRQAFRPTPAVDSSVLVIEPRPDVASQERLEALRVLTRVAFSRRRKQLGRILRSAPEYALAADEVERVLDSIGVSGRARPETLTPSQFLSLAAILGEAES
jgi:16S rRNA (adenine1518-N6/adenine1519-N6)-dimethyltransferase